MADELQRRGLDITAVVIALIVGLPPTIGSIASLVISLRTSDKVQVVAEKVEVVHKATNSLTDRLVNTTRSDALQEGHTQGLADAKAKK